MLTKVMLRRLLLSSVFLSLLSIASLPVQARQCDAVSFAIIDGRCIDLSAFSDLTAIRRQIADNERQLNPIAVTRLRLKSTVHPNYLRIEGTVINQSRRSVRGGMVTVRLQDGRVEEMMVRSLRPGQSASISTVIDRERLPASARVTVDSIDVF
jgi:hypothetical protein